MSRKVCLGCRRPNHDEDAEFCNSCGAAIQMLPSPSSESATDIARKVCPGCGRLNHDEDAEFCNSCGAAVHVLPIRHNGILDDYRTPERMSGIHEMALLKKDLTEQERVQFDLQLMGLQKNPTTALLLGLFFGYLGVDRFYIGDTLLGVAKLLTLGGAFVWAVYDLFVIGAATREKNLRTAKEIRESLLFLRR